MKDIDDRHGASAQYVALGSPWQTEVPEECKSSCRSWPGRDRHQLALMRRSNLSRATRCSPTPH